MSPENDEVVEAAPTVEQEPIITRPAASRTLNEDEVVTHRVTPPFVRIIAWIVGILILALLIVLLARWVYHKSHHAVQPAPANTRKLPAQSSSLNTNQTTGNTAGNSQPSNNSSNTSGSSNSTSTQNNNLPNSGPGQTAAIFAGASLTAGGIHYIISTRRANKLT